MLIARVRAVEIKFIQTRISAIYQLIKKYVNHCILNIPAKHSLLRYHKIVNFYVKYTITQANKITPSSYNNSYISN